MFVFLGAFFANYDAEVRQNNHLADEYARNAYRRSCSTPKSP